MTGTARRGWFVGGAAAVAIVAVGLAGRPSAGGPPPPPPDPRPAVVVAGAETARPPTPRLVPRREALRVARRFAAAYARWDAGEHGADLARSLARTATPQLLARVQAQQARPSVRPARPLRLTVNAVSHDAENAYRVPLALDGPPASHVVTLVVTSTVNGTRVTSVER